MEMAGERMKGIHIQITDRCNLKCKQCDAWKSIPRKELSTKEWKEIIDKLHDEFGNIGIHFCGGEPFLRKDLTELIRYCSDKGFEMSVITNFTLIEDKVEDIAGSGLHNLIISLDSITNDKLLYLRGQKNMFDRFRKILWKFNNCKTRPNIIIAVILMGYNMDDVMKILDIARTENLFDGVFFQPLMQNFGQEYDPKWYLKSKLFPKDIKKMEELIDHIIKVKRETEGIIHNSIEHLKLMKKYFENPEKFGQEFTCKSGYDNLAVNSNGEAFLCWNMSPIGDIKTGELSKIMSSNTAKKMRKQISKCNRQCGILSCNYKKLRLGIFIPICDESKSMFKQSLSTWKKIKLPEGTEVYWVTNVRDKKTKEYMDELKTLKKPYGYFESKADGYKAADLNEAIREIEPECVAVFDCDSIPNKDFLIKGLEKMEEGYDAVQGEKYIYNANENLITNLKSIEAYRARVLNRKLEMNMENCILHGSGMIFKTAALKGVGYFPISLVEDHDLRTRLVNKKIGFVDSKYYEEAPNSILGYILQRSRWAYTQENLWEDYKISWKMILENLLYQLSYIICGIRKLFKLKQWGHTKKKGKNEKRTDNKRALR